MSIVLCLTLALGNGACLQVIAWAGMLATRTADQGLSNAVESTFSGKRPCHLCCVVAALDRQDDAGAPPTATKKMVKADLFAPVVAIEVVGWSGKVVRPPMVDHRLPVRLLAPPEPPPPRQG